MKVSVDWKLCEGNGVCAIEAPDVFEMDDDDELTLLDETPDESARARVVAAARACPKRAITVT